MKFKNIDELMTEYKKDAKDIPAPFQNSYILGRLESAYEILHNEYLEVITKRK